jgi:hypothetical protein
MTTPTPSPWEETEMAREVRRMLTEDYGAVVADLMLRHRDVYHAPLSFEKELQIGVAEAEAYRDACIELTKGLATIKN